MQRWQRRLAVALATGVVAMTMAGGAAAARFTQFVAFGDSLSDAGNAAASSGGLFPPSPLPYAGPASNGPTAAQYLAGRYGIPVQLGWPTASAGSNNYAVLGAMNDSRNYNVEIGSPPGLGLAFPALASSGIGQQVARYQAVNPGVPDPANTLFLVWGGANDVFLALESPGATPQTVSQALGLSLQAMQGNLLTLAGLGARHLLVPSLPDLGLTPEALAAGPATAGVLSGVSQAYNQGLDQLIDGLDQALAPLGVALYEFDTPAFFAGILADPAGHGFTDTTGACFNRQAPDLSNVLAGCPGFLYFDNVHPTTAAHALLAEAFAARVPEPDALALVLLASGLALAQGRRARRRGGAGRRSGH